MKVESRTAAVTNQARQDGIRPRGQRIACDSLVALGSATAEGSVLFAKNSDRPASECQPLTLVPGATHAAASSCRCTYIEIPQVRRTARVLGSRPHWCWGFEHGLNEHGVAIGNHTVFAKETPGGRGLIGMDLVRLGLERGTTAAQAAEVISNLLATYGQGGSGYADMDWPYNNSFLIADRAQAYVLETSDRRWALRRVRDVASVSNHLTIARDWDVLSEDTIEHAVRQGWWPAGGSQRFDFAKAYRDAGVVPEVTSSGRHRRTRALLDAGNGRLSVADMKRALRDHYGSPAPVRDCTPAEERYFSVCMHADPVGTTTASMIASLPTDPDEPLLYWASLGWACVGAFLPIFVDGEVPESLTRGDAQPRPDSAWWRLHDLGSRVAAAWEDRLPIARRTFDEFELATAERIRAGGVLHWPASRRQAFVAATEAELRELAERLLARW